MMVSVSHSSSLVIAVPRLDDFRLEHNGCGGRCPVTGATWSQPAFYLHVRTWCIFRWLELASADLSRRHLFWILRLEPFQPIRPPRAGVLCCRLQPAFNIRA